MAFRRNPRPPPRRKRKPPANVNKLTKLIKNTQLRVCETKKANRQYQNIALKHNATHYSNKEKVQILKSFTVTHAPNNSNVSGGKQLTIKNCWVNLKNMKVKYDSDDGQYPKWKDIGVAVVCYDSNSTAYQTQIGEYNYSARLFFKDP
jgi:hypothetical protein